MRPARKCGEITADCCQLFKVLASPDLVDDLLEPGVRGHKEIGLGMQPSVGRDVEMFLLGTALGGGGGGGLAAGSHSCWFVVGLKVKRICKP